MSKFVFCKSPWTVRFDCSVEKQMRDGFVRVAEEIFFEEALYLKDGVTFYAGMELEFPIIQNGFSPTTQDVRDEITNRFPKHTSVELGANQLEIIHEPPVDICRSGIGALENDMQTNFSAIQKEIQKKSAMITRVGCYPLIDIEKVAHTKGEQKYAKYERSPLWHMEHQRPGAPRVLRVAEPINVSNAYVVSLMNAAQITVDAESFADAIDKLNRSLMISPMAVALGANARYLGLCDTGYADVRFVAWEISHDSRSYEELASGRQTRVGLPRRYYTGLNDYFNRILTYPFIMNDSISLEHPFEVGTGIYWRDARLKFFRNKKTIAVEFRPVALQPTLHEDIGMMVFYLGRLLWSQHEKETLIPIEYVRVNKLQAMKRGMNCKLYSLNGSAIQLSPASIVLACEINKAEKGLQLLGTETAEINYFFEPLRQRLSSGSPAECFAKKVKECEQKLGRREALISTIQELNLVQ